MLKIKKVKKYSNGIKYTVNLKKYKDSKLLWDVIVDIHRYFPVTDDDFSLVESTIDLEDVIVAINKNKFQILDVVKNMGGGNRYA